ncbi:hypothetical protein LOAG_15928, partial [Loa loa]
NGTLSSLDLTTDNSVVHYPVIPIRFQPFTVPSDGFSGLRGTVKVVQPSQQNNEDVIEDDDIPDDFHWVLFGNENKKSKIQPSQSSNVNVIEYNDIPDVEKYKCSHVNCNETTRSKTKCLEHIRKHHERFPYQCKQPSSGEEFRNHSSSFFPKRK